jgi:DNA invertase Pin-like site-specific DNA recombinase
MKAPELYEAEIARYCAYRQLQLVKTYSDIDYSGYRGSRPRPSLEALLKARKNYGAIVVPKLSRFGRSLTDLVKLFEIFDNDRIDLVFLDVGVDTSTSQVIAVHRGSSTCALACTFASSTGAQFIPVHPHSSLGG